MADVNGGIALYTAAERAHWSPIPEQDRPRLLELVRAGANVACVDCGASPLDGGLRCVPCFGKRCGEKVRARPSWHGSEKGYQTHRALGEPACGECREGHNRYRRELRSRKVAA